MLAICFCYHRSYTKQKNLVLSQVVPSSTLIAPTSLVHDTKATYLKLASLNERNSSSRSSSFTVSSLHSHEQSENDEEFCTSGSFQLGLSGSGNSSSSNSLSDHLSEGDMDGELGFEEMKSTGSSEVAGSSEGEGSA